MSILSKRFNSASENRFSYGLQTVRCRPHQPFRVPRPPRRARG